MIYTKSEIEHIAAEMCQQDWSDLRFQDVYYRAFIDGASYFNSIPDGYVLVPVEPTDAMAGEFMQLEDFVEQERIDWETGDKYIQDWRGNRADFNEAYKRMLAAVRNNRTTEQSGNAGMFADAPCSVCGGHGGLWDEAICPPEVFFSCQHCKGTGKEPTVKDILTVRNGRTTENK